VSKLPQTCPNNQIAQPKNRKRLFLATALLVIAALVAVTSYPLSSQLKQGNSQQNNQTSPQTLLQSSQQKLSPESWMVKGAYANYQGKVIGVAVPVNINGKMQVIDLNATHVQIQTDMNMATPFAPTIADRTSQWINKANIVFQPKGETLANTYKTQITVEGIGNRSCTAYDFTNEAINATYYIDQTLQWPLKIVYTTAFESKIYQIEINLLDTNIKGL
jgi:hypothetical protein